MSSAFKTYVFRHITEKGAVLESQIQLALKEDLDAERSPKAPDLSNAVTTKQLVEFLNQSEVMKAAIIEDVRARNGGEMPVLRAPKKPTLIERIKAVLA